MPRVSGGAQTPRTAAEAYPSLAVNDTTPPARASRYDWDARSPRVGVAAQGRRSTARFLVPAGILILMAGVAAGSFLYLRPMTASTAAKVILDGVKAERWRILVGQDAELLDGWVRGAPEAAYDPDFHARFAAEAGWKLG